MLRFASEEAGAAITVDVDAASPGEQFDDTAKCLEVEIMTGLAQRFCGAVENVIDEARKRVAASFDFCYLATGKADAGRWVSRSQHNRSVASCFEAFPSAWIRDPHSDVSKRVVSARR